MSRQGERLEAQLREILSGRYELEGELARGSMARVYRAWSLDENRRPVAVKLLPPELAHEGNTERFAREIAIVADLEHPNILSVLESGSGDGLAWYVMPFVPGENIRELMGRQGLPSIASTLDIVRQVGLALTYAHEHGVVHRDLKPENVMVTEGHVLVMDFGLARAAESTSGLTGAGMPLGTPAYMSPEQILGAAAVDHRADIYSFGCLVYEMLTGQPPFVAPDVVALLRAHMQRTPSPPSGSRARVTPAMDRAVLAALAKDPADRPATAAALVDLLACRTVPAEEYSAGSVTAPPKGWRRFFGKR